jgi:hypothetical protein
MLLAAIVGGLLARPVGGHAATGLEGVPHYDHVFTIVLENENYSQSWDTPGPDGNETYLQSLRHQGVFADHYYGTTHVSAGNYMAMTSGQPPISAFNADCIVNWTACVTFERAWPDGGRSIADQAEESGHTWKGYMDGMAVPCQHPAATDLSDPYQTGYATRHDPFVYYPPIIDDQARCDSHVVPYTALAQDLQSEATTPNYAFITPDTCNDGHDAPCTGSHAGEPGGLTSANAWLSTEVPKILGSPAFTTPGVNSVLLITFDENGFTDRDGCCGLFTQDVSSTLVAFGGRIGLVAVGTGITPGKTVSTVYDHWSYLRTVEDALGIDEHLNMAGLPATKAMSDLFG